MSIVAATAACLFAAGCAKADREGVVALRADLERIDSRIGDISARVSRVDQSVHNYDTWTLRIQAVAPWLLLALPLPYIAGKIVWLITERFRNAARRRRR